MKKFRLLNRLGLALITLALLAAGLSVPAARVKAVDADTFYGSWPYAAPPKGNLNYYNGDSITGAGIGIWGDLIEPPLAYYQWAEGTYRGMLAKSWGYNKEGTKYTVTLKDGLTWSDGSKLTSKDLVSTLLINELVGDPVFVYGGESVAATDDYTVEYTLNKPPSAILERYILKTYTHAASIYGKIADKLQGVLDAGLKAGKKRADIKASDDYQNINKELTDFRPASYLSSGPYTLDMKDVTDAQLVLRRTDKSSFKNAKFDKIVIYNGDTDVTTPLLLSGELYYATDYFPPASEKSLVEKGYTILRGPTYSGPGLFFNNTIYPLNKPEVRQAIAYAIDRSRATKVSYGQAGAPVKYMVGISDSLVDRFIDPAAIKTLNTYDYNPKKAEEILTKLGFKKNGDVWADDKGKNLEFELSVPSDFTDWNPAAQDVADQLTAFGIKITLRAYPNDQQRPDVKDGKFQIAVRLWGFPNPFPFFAFRNMMIRNAVNKTAKDPGMSYPTKQKIGGKDIDFEALVADMSKGATPKDTMEAVTAATVAFNTDLPVVPLIERFYNSPLGSQHISGLPPESDKLYQNAQGSDSFVVIWLIDGTIGPKK